VTGEHREHGVTGMTGEHGDHGETGLTGEHADHRETGLTGEHADHGDHQHHHQLDWLTALEQERHEAKHHYLHRFDWRGEPIPEDFDGPRFYPPDPGWRLEARLDREAPGTGDQVTLATSTGKLRDMAITGQLVFTTPGGERRLTTFRSAQLAEDEPLFVPFQDATSGTETYGAGRYLDVFLDEDETAVLDFNLAYNPSCAYSPRYDCPYPPRGNRLDIPVRAGEMVPFKHD
jgi:uncharacterized protein (DUF1684 family)